MIRTKHLIALLLFALGGLLLPCASHAAIQAFSNDRTDFLNLITVTTNINFSTIPTPSGPDHIVQPMDYIPFSTSAGLTLQGVNFVGKYGVGGTPYELAVSGGIAQGNQNDYNFGPDALGSRAVLVGPAGDQFSYKNTNITVNLPANTCVFGTDLMMKRNWNYLHNPNNSNTHMKVTLFDGIKNTEFIVNMLDSVNAAGDPTRSFFGFISDTSISSVTFHAGASLSGFITVGSNPWVMDAGHPILDNVVLGECQHSVPEPASMVIFAGLAGFGLFAARRRKQSQVLTK